MWVDTLREWAHVDDNPTKRQVALTLLALAKLEENHLGASEHLSVLVSASFRS